MHIGKKNFNYICIGLIIVIAMMVYLNILKISSTKQLSLCIYIIFIYICTVYLFVKARFYFINPAVLFCGVYLITVCIGPIILLPSGYEYNFNVLPVLVGAYIAFLCGNSLAPEIHRGRRLKFSIGIRMKRETILICLIAISALVWLIYIAGNLNSIFSGNFESDRITSQSGNGASLYLIKMWILTVPMLYEEQKRNGTVKKWFYAIVVAVLAMLLVLGGRSPVIIIVLELAICKIIIDKIDTSRIFRYAVLGVLGLGVLGVWRAAASNGSTTLLASLSSVLLNSNYNLSYIFGRFPSIVNFQYGYTYAINFLMLLPGPDLDFTLWLKEQLGMSFSGGGVTPTIVGEFYINWGYVGIYVGMFVLGAVAKFLHQYLSSSSCKAYPIFLCICFSLAVLGGIANYSIQVLLYTIVYSVVRLLSAEE